MPQELDSSLRIRFQEELKHGARIKVVGVGGGGLNAVNRMIEAGVQGVDFISVNTDLQSLKQSRAKVRLQLGSRLTRGLGTGANPEIGRRVALEDSDKIIEALEDADMVFVTAGLGGGTGTGAAPVIASLASQMGALTIAIVTRPFAFEGKRRMNQAEQGVQELLDHADTLIVIPNERLLATAMHTGFFESFQIADDVLRQAVQGISDIITVRGVINRDFADVRTTMEGMGYAVMGTATRTGPHRATEAANAAITSPLLEAGAIDGSRNILINITGSSSLKLAEVSEASTIIQSAAHDDANIIFGAVLDERLGDEVKVTVIATGFRQQSSERTKGRLSTLNPIELPTFDYEDLPPPGVYAPIYPDVPVAPEPQTNESDVVEAAASFMHMQTLPLEKALGPSSRADDEESAQHGGEARVTLDTPTSLMKSEREIDTTTEWHSTNEWFEDDLLANIDGPVFDLVPVLEELPTHPEVARLRQTALAAYAATSISEEDEDDRDVKPEGTSFAEVLAAREMMIERAYRSANPDKEIDGAQSFDVSDAPIFRSSATSFVRPGEKKAAGPNGTITGLPEVVTKIGGSSLDKSPFANSLFGAESETEIRELDIPAFLRRRT